MVTAESLTDKQIKVEWRIALDSGDRDMARAAQVALGTWTGSHRWQASHTHLTPACAVCGDTYRSENHIQHARELIAAAINARAKGGGGCRMPDARAKEGK